MSASPERNDALSNERPIDAGEHDLLTAVFAGYSEALMIVDPKSLRVISANNRACLLLGYSRQELYLLDIASIESSIENLFYWEEARNGSVLAAEARSGYFRMRSGEILAVQNRIDVIPTHAGVLALVVFNADSGQQVMRDELARSSALLAATLEATADGILVTRLDGSIGNMSQRFAQMWRIPNEILSAGSDQAIFEYLREQAADSEVYSYQLINTLNCTDVESVDLIDLKDGRRFERYATPLHSNGQMAGFVFSYRDITERTQFEATLREKNIELEKASRIKSEFLANMSHEIRTPMNGIIGLSRLCLNTELSAQQRDYVEKIFFSGESLLGIINDILDLSKIEAGKLSIEAIPFRLDDVIERVLHLTRATAESKCLAISVNVVAQESNQDLFNTLVGDPLRLGQVLINLVSNAIKFTERGTISISVANTDTNTVQDRTELKFTVKDTGIGLTLEQCGKLFKSFSQADSSTTRKFGGTGLGLAISKSLVEMMQGTIGVTSAPNAGSTFSFTARFGRTDTIVAPTRNMGNAVGGVASMSEIRGARVLVVEDNRINQQIARELLTQAGLVVEMANNGAEGVAKLAEQTFDAVLMDVQMPVMDGYEATKAIRAQDQYKSLPIIALTANAMVGDDQRCIEAGMNCHVSKPVDPEELFAALCKWIAPGTRRPIETVQLLVENLDHGLPMSLPHIDLDVALKGVGGNRNLIKNLLLMFWHDHRDDMQSLELALALGNRDFSKRLVHTLKGIAGSIGALRLQAAARIFDEELRTHQDGLSEAALSELQQSFAEVVDGLQSFAVNAKNSAPETSAPEHSQQSVPSASTKPLVLIVDDEPMIITILTSLLKNDYEIATAINGEEALKYLADHPPNLILLDANMPILDGYQVCGRVRADVRYQTTPVVFVSGSDNQEDLDHAKAVGATDYLFKPIKRDAVLSCVRKYLA